MDDMAAPDMSEQMVAHIASQTLANVADRYANIKFDRGVKAAFQFLVYLAVSSRSENPQAGLQELGIRIGDKPTTLAFAKAVHDWVACNRQSLEYGRMAAHAAGDALAAWHQIHQSSQLSLFDVPPQPYLVWRAAGDGSGFCELSRLFFARLTERYLNYFLEREASAAIPTVDGRLRFRDRLEEHVEDVSGHAFETSKITQSFAAGWFNRNSRLGVPDTAAIDGFLSHAFDKMREELLLERQQA